MSPLAKQLMKKFVKDSVIWTVLTPILMFLVVWLIKIINFQFIGFFSDEVYGRLMLLYHGLSRYPWIVVGIVFLIWVIGEVVLVIKLMKRASNYVEIISNETVYLAHDLKTPLTSIIGYLSLMAENKEISKEDQIKYTNIALDKAYRLEGLINEFFEIATVSHSNIELEYTKVDLVLMLQQLSYEFQPMLSEKNSTCNIQGEQTLMVNCDPGKLQRVFDNLLKNAVNYSSSGQAINITVESDNNQAVIAFENKGNTIGAKDLDKIFEKFYRLDQSRSTKDGGAGLGLAISKEIVELHKGTIKAESKDGITRFVVKLPIE